MTAISPRHLELSRGRVVPTALARWPSERIGQYLLWLLLAFVPWPFGAVDAQSKCVVAVLVAGLALCLIKRVLFERRTFTWTWAYFPLIGLALVAWLSTLPLPFAWVRFLAPQNLALRAELLNHLPIDALGTGTTVSFYPAATRVMLRLVVGSGIIFASVINFCRRPAQVRRMLLALVITGAAVAVEALLQDATSAGMIYWTVPAPVKSTSGPFVNYNNFCQYMNLAIAAGLALLLMRCSAANTEKGARSGESLKLPPAGALIAMIVMAGTCILLSSSRGGVLAMLAAGAFVGLALLMLRAGGKSIKTLALVAAALILVLISCGLEAFMARMATLSDLQSASGMRWQVFQDVLAFAPRFSVWGIGLGAHEFVYPMFSHLGTWRNAQFVENEYLQLFEEMGVVGVVLGGSFLGAMVWHLVRALRQRRTSLAFAAAGLSYGLVAICVGSMTDFGQRLASISSVTAVVLGLIVAICRLESEPAQRPMPNEREERGASLGKNRSFPWRAPLFALALLGIAAWLVNGATRAAAAEQHWTSAVVLEKQLVKQDWQGGDEPYHALVTEARAAVDWDPDNAEYRCWMNIYRWHQALRPAAWAAMSDGERGQLFADLLAEFQRGEVLCPTYGLNYAMAGQIRYMGLRDDAGAEEIRRAYQLAPTHPAVCFIAGRLAAQEGKWEEARDDFRRAIELHYPREEVLALYVDEIKRPDLAPDVFADSWEYLAAAASAMEKNPDQAQLAQEVRLKSQVLLTAEAQKPEAPVQTLAAMADLLLSQEDPAGAARYYRRAIDAHYARAESHLGLAKALAKLGQSASARQEVDICLSLKPDWPPARRMLSDLATPGSPTTNSGDDP